MYFVYIRPVFPGPVTYVCRHRRQTETHNDNRFMYVHTVDNGLLTIDYRVSIITDFV